MRHDCCSLVHAGAKLAHCGQHLRVFILDASRWLTEVEGYVSGIAECLFKHERHHGTRQRDSVVRTRD